MGVIIQAASLVAGESRKGTAAAAAAEGVSEPAWGGARRRREGFWARHPSLRNVRMYPRVPWNNWARAAESFLLGNALATEILFVSREREYGRVPPTEKRTNGKMEAPTNISTLKMLMRLFASTIAAFESA